MVTGYRACYKPAGYRASRQLVGNTPNFTIGKDGTHGACPPSACLRSAEIKKGKKRSATDADVLGFCSGQAVQSVMRWICALRVGSGFEGGVVPSACA